MPPALKERLKWRPVEDYGLVLERVLRHKSEVEPFLLGPSLQLCLAYHRPQGRMRAGRGGGPLLCQKRPPSSGTNVLPDGHTLTLETNHFYQA